MESQKLRDVRDSRRGCTGRGAILCVTVFEHLHMTTLAVGMIGDSLNKAVSERL